MLNGIFDPGAAMPDSPTDLAPGASQPDNPSTTPAPATKGDAKFVGSRNSKVYHYPGCSVVHQIKPENLVEYSEAPAGKRLPQGCPR